MDKIKYLTYHRPLISLTQISIGCNISHLLFPWLVFLYTQHGILTLVVMNSKQDMIYKIVSSFLGEISHVELLQNG